MQQHISSQIMLDILLHTIQQDICVNCPVYKYENRNCCNCEYNIERKFKNETIYFGGS